MLDHACVLFDVTIPFLEVFNVSYRQFQLYCKTYYSAKAQFAPPTHPPESSFASLSPLLNGHSYPDAGAGDQDPHRPYNSHADHGSGVVENTQNNSSNLLWMETRPALGPSPSFSAAAKK